MDIDFVITWVDNEDPQWQAAFQKWLPANTSNIDDSEPRYRDWHLLRYWFRGVEQFAPWVRRIHFVTNGQLPSWLNTQHPKLHLVKHSDIMPPESLPTFNSNAIEMCLDKIEGLSEDFVYFNDDVFLVGNVGQDYFFRNGQPCDVAVTWWRGQQGNDMMNHIVSNNVNVINSRFDKYATLFRHFGKWFWTGYGWHQLRGNIQSLLNPQFASFLDPHSALALQKHTIGEVRRFCPGIMEATTRQRFRSTSDISPWLFRYWRLCKGEFTKAWQIPERHYYFHVEQQLDDLSTDLTDEKIKIVVLNDSSTYQDFVRLIADIKHRFEQLLPKPSLFECTEKHDKDL